jgi:hypothetical protein
MSHVRDREAPASRAEEEMEAADAAAESRADCASYMS